MKEIRDRREQGVERYRARLAMATKKPLPTATEAFKRPAYNHGGKKEKEEE